MWRGISLGLLVTVLALGCLGQLAHAQNYALDRASTCNQNIAVYDTELRFTARSNVAPVNPPLECVVHLESAYEMADGRFRLEIVVEELQVEDCNVKLAFYNGRGTTGNYLRLLGCGSSSTDIIRSEGREVTIRFTRPLHLYQTAYAITFTVKTYGNPDDMGTNVSRDKLPIGAIIGIVVGILVLIAIGILLCWCCRTGYIYNFINGGRGSSWKEPAAGDKSTTMRSVGYIDGSIDSNLEKLSTVSSTAQLKNGINYEDPAVWSSLTGLNKESNRNFRRGVPRKAVGREEDADSAVEMRSRPEHEVNRGNNHRNGEPGRDSHVYEPYDTDTNLDRSPRFRKRKDDPRGSNRSRGSRRSGNLEGEGAGRGQGKETLIDDPGTGLTEDEDDDLKKIPLDSDDTTEAANLHKFGSEADVDTIASQLHINAGVRASVPDLTEEPPPPSPPSKHRSKASPKSRRRPKGQGGPEPDPMGLPPEAFDPVFTTPTSQEQYPGEFRPVQTPAMPFMPYGMFPMVPGQQTYAYAYQTAPQVGSYPGNQGAYFMQSVPTGDGDVQNTAFIMKSTRTPKQKGSKGKMEGAHPGAPEYTSTPGDSSRQGAGSQPPDMSLIAAGAAPPNPDAGHRSMAMKSFADPDTGIQTTQVLWTDNVPDPSDPKPGDSSQVTRKTTTRVTTRSGHGDLPTQTTTLLDYQDPNPAFLAPSSSVPSHHPAAITPNTTNVDYYTGERSAPVKPPDVVHEGPSRNRAIRDRISFGDSTA